MSRPSLVVGINGFVEDAEKVVVRKSATRTRVYVRSRSKVGELVFEGLSNTMLDPSHEHVLVVLAGNGDLVFSGRTRMIGWCVRQTGDGPIIESALFEHVPEVRTPLKAL